MRLGTPLFTSGTAAAISPKKSAAFLKKVHDNFAKTDEEKGNSIHMEILQPCLSRRNLCHVIG
jgi:hypothetical protein